MKSKPWITTALRVSINIKNKLFKKYITTKSTYYHTKFKLYRNKLNHLLKVSKNNYYNNYFYVNMSDSKKVWKGIRQLVNFKSRSGSTAPNKLLVEDTEINDPKAMADAFNNFFANIGNNLTKTIPRVNKSPLQYLTTPSQDNFFLFPTTTVEIENDIIRLNANKSTGPFSIPVTVLKATKHAISKPLEIIFNASFSTGIVPSNLKIAKVTPVFKKGLQTNLNNYRPISILSIFNKLLEKLMHKRILDFLEKKKGIYCKQFGFRAKHSTDHAILSIIDLIQHAIDCHEFSCGIFLDFSKAFDTVNHNILIEKLDYYGIRGVAKDWSGLPTGTSLFPWATLCQNFNLFLVVFLKVQFLAHYYFFCILMTLAIALKF